MREEWRNPSLAHPCKPVLPADQWAVRRHAARDNQGSGVQLVQPLPDGRENTLDAVDKKERLAGANRAVDEKMRFETTGNFFAKGPSRSAGGSAFESSTDVRFFYPSYQHVEGLNRFRYALTETKNYVGLLTGEFGSGKSYLARLFMEELWLDRHVHSAYVVAGNHNQVESILKDILSQITFIPEPFLGGDQVRLLEMLKEFLHRTVAIGKEKLVIILDETEHVKSSDLLLLQNLTHARGTPIIPVLLILIGHLKLEKLVSELPPLQSRIGLRFHLDNFSRSDTQAYIMHRLAAARASVTFSNEIYDVMYSTTSGNPRRLDLLCKVLLDFQRLHPEGKLTVKQVIHIAADLESLH